MDIAAIREQQQVFNDAIAEHEELNNARNECHERSDERGELECLSKMKELGNRAVNAQAKIKALMIA